MPTSGGNVDMFSSTKDTWDRSRFPNKINIPLKRLIIYVLLKLENPSRFDDDDEIHAFLNIASILTFSSGPAIESSTSNCKVQDPASLEKMNTESGHDHN